MPWKNRKRAIRKRSFLLFELMISFSLLLLCLIPLIKIHTGIAKEECKQIKLIEEKFEVQKSFFELKEALLEHKFTWNELVEEKAKPFKKLAKSTKKPRDSTKNDSEGALVLGVTLNIKDRTYEKMFFVKKTPTYPH